MRIWGCSFEKCCNTATAFCCTIGETYCSGTAGEDCCDSAQGETCCDGVCCSSSETCCAGAVAGGPVCEPASCSFGITGVEACPGSTVEMSLTGLCEPDCDNMTFSMVKSHPYLTVNLPGVVECQGSPHVETFTVDVAADTPGGGWTFMLEGTSSDEATCTADGTVTVSELTLNADPSTIVATTAWPGMPPGLDLSTITLDWDPIGCDVALEIVEIEPQGNATMPAEPGTLTQIDATTWEYSAFEEPKSQLCTDLVRVWIGAMVGGHEVDRVSIMVENVHFHWTWGAAVDFPTAYNYVVWKYATVLATTGGAFTGGVAISADPCVPCGFPSVCVAACTHFDDSVDFGTSAFTGSENRAGSIIGHELVHTVGFFNASECAAYTWEVDHVLQTGTAQCDVAYSQEIQGFQTTECP